MSTDNFTISYPSINPGTDKSLISFHSGTPDLVSLFYENNSETKRRFFVTDATVASLDCMKEFVSKFDDGIYGQDCLLILGSGEPYKTIESVLTIVNEAVEANFTRNDIFVGIGGGVICDTTAFAASIFKRGASVQFVPTTLLAMVDASIGGKTGCDFDNCKNIIGTFFPASKLYYFPQFVQYLPEGQYNSGLAEAFKTALLFDEELYNIFKNDSEKLIARDKDLLEIVIQKCVRAKAAIVEQDFTEKNIRKYLNLGHTFGHALESVAGLGLVTHGAAIAWGIGRSAQLAFNKDYCNQAFVDEVLSILELYNWETKEVPSVITGGGIGERLLTVMHKDKKNINSNVSVVMLKGIKNISVEEVTDNDILAVLK